MLNVHLSVCLNSVQVDLFSFTVRDMAIAFRSYEAVALKLTLTPRVGLKRIN